MKLEPVDPPVGPDVNEDGAPRRLDRARQRFRLLDVSGPLRMFVNGYQSWSPTRWVRVGVDTDPSRTRVDDPVMQDVVGFARQVHHADPAVAPAGWLRSEAVTVLTDGSGDHVLVGFLDGSAHDGTIRVHDDEVVAEASFGGAVLAPGDARPVAEVVVLEGDDPDALLGRWAATVGRAAGARVDAPYQVGWCSWYHYFHDVTEAAVRENLALAGDWPFEVFQLDDGYQAAIGDWTVTNERFPSGVDGVADAIAGAGYGPGIWLAPFLAAPDAAAVAGREHRLARTAGGEPLMGWWNPAWGGFMWALDTTHPEVQQHLAETAAALVAMGYRYLKLDFTVAPAIEGVWHDPSRTPAERVRAGYDAIRRGAGDDVFLLGCGCPLGAVVGLVDGMRIGPDVAPSWDRDPDEFAMPGYEDVSPATAMALRSTEARQFMHRRLWLNDPDCLMLRTTETQLTPEQVQRWADAVAESGGMALVSDDLSLLGPGERALLDKVVARGREVDATMSHGPDPQPLADR